MYFLVKALLVVGLLFFATGRVDISGVWLFALLVLLLSVPITLQGAYRAAVRRGHYLSMFHKDGWVYRLFAGPLLRIILHTLIGLALAAVMMFRLRALEPLEWICFVMAIPVFALALRWMVPARQMAWPFRLAVSLRWASYLTLGVLLLAYTAWVWITGAGPTQTVTHVEVGYQPASALVSELSVLLNFWKQMEAFVLGHVASFENWGRMVAGLIMLLGNLTLFWGFTAVLACLQIPAAEMVRILAPASSESKPPGLTVPMIAWTSALATLFVVFIYFPSLALLEGRLQQQPVTERPVSKMVKIVEKIGNGFFQPGTAAELDSARLEYLRDSPAADILAQQINSGFDQMETNLDGFLDWYYTLPAEYARLGTLLMGDFHGHLTTRLEEHLLEGEPFSGMEAALDQGVGEERTLRFEYNKKCREILARNRLEVENTALVSIVTEEKDLAACRAPIGADVFSAIQRRLRARAIASGNIGAGAGVSALIVAAVVKKAAAKGAVKAASQAAVKTLASKAAAKGFLGVVGGTIGGVLGSVVPGPGTIAGAAVGAALLGVLAGVGVDAMLLKLEEALGREAFKASIMVELEQMRSDYLALVEGPQ